MARKDTDMKAPKESRTQDETEQSVKEKAKAADQKTTPKATKAVSKEPEMASARSLRKKSKEGKAKGVKPMTPPAPPSPAGPPKKTKRPSQEATDQKSMKSGNAAGGKKASSPVKTDGAAAANSNNSTIAHSWASQRNPTISAKEFHVLEEHIARMPSFHGYVCREDLNGLLKRNGDWLLRLSVQPNEKEAERKEKKKEKTASKESPKKRGTKEKMTGTARAGFKSFVLSVNAKSKEKPKSPDKSSGLSVIRNLIIKLNDGHVSIEPTKQFKTIGELIANYQKNSGIHKDGEFQLLTAIPLSPWEFQHEDVEMTERKLGEGAFGDVRVGRLKPKDTKAKAVEVAVKMLKNATETITRDQVNELLHEARVMRLLEHPNVLRCQGIVVLREPLYLMSELCACGALREYLKENQKTVTLAEKLNFALGSARGVEYIHSQKVIHRDLAVRNILLSEDKTPKVSDFGLAKQTDRYEMKEHCKIPVRYLAPETLEAFVFTAKTDVFSFGCVIWEIYENGQQPHDGKNAQTIRAQVKKREFLKLSPSAPELLRKFVADRVFVADPENRCSMNAIVQSMEQIEKSMKK
ncbi:unnamed protein product [Caenorhabditis sp. 36 PRJEB53466]|nr:unnamed protein product [Caenorhabditis sp. 36 PRJEB53466]